MDYLLNTYFFNYLPFAVSDGMKKQLTVDAFEIVRVADWFLRLQDPRKIIAENITLFAVEIIFTFQCLLTFIHAFRHGRRYLFTWIGILAIGLLLENVRLVSEQANIIFYSPGVVTMFGMRTPLYVLLGMYHILVYIAYVMTRRLNLSCWAEGPVCALFLLLIEFPVHLVGVKLLWWQWHDSEPNLEDRSYSVPWMMYALDSFLVCSFIWILHGLRRLVLDYKYDWMFCMRELICSISASLMAVGVAVLASNVFILAPHYLLKIHTSVPVLLLFAVLITSVLFSDRQNFYNRSRLSENKYWFDEIACAIFLHYLFFMTVVVVSDPLNIVSEGLHQPLGPCNITEEKMFFNIELSRRKYLCAELNNFDCFDFHCVGNTIYRDYQDRKKSEPLEWYVICGVDFANRLEYICVIWGASLISLLIFYKIFVRTASTPLDPFKEYVRRYKDSRLLSTPNQLHITRSIEQQMSSDEEKTTEKRTKVMKMLKSATESSESSSKNSDTKLDEHLWEEMTGSGKRAPPSNSRSMRSRKRHV